MSADDFAIQRQHMVAEIAARTLLLHGAIGKAALDEQVMAAMATVPRHEFVPVEVQPLAYANTPLPIGFAVSPARASKGKQWVEVRVGSACLFGGTDAAAQVEEVDFSVIAYR